MLRVINVVKRYVTKGETVTALDGVSVDFPERGMVFLLGKSGSGKSTLLNVAGGLDAPDEGEVVVEGKSTNSYTKDDYDSYRNTYVGFVFQEYNILGELTVAENIALAVELQGQPRDENRVRALLEQVDLKDMGDRRPNTLSGGQKQRVAIARALIKDPKIIMADEPMGALDSATGAQVLDTLKKLSESRLVVVVSHDREFAERYADRIIELKDGKIVSDVSRSGEGKAVNLTLLSPDKLSVACGAELTEEDERRILDFVRRNKGGILLTASPESAGEPSGQANLFVETIPEPPGEERESAAFIKSKFPMRYAVRMGAAGLKVKPVRLVFTVLLAAFAFVVFGVFSTLITYSASRLGLENLLASDYTAAVLTKKTAFHYSSGSVRYAALGNDGSYFTAEEADSLREEYPDMNFIPVFDFGSYAIFYTTNLGLREGRTQFSGFAETKYLSDSDGTLVAGRYPQTSTECMISAAVYECFAAGGYRESDGTILPVASYEDLLEKWIYIAGSNPSGMGVFNVSLTVVGIYDTAEVIEAKSVTIPVEDSELFAYSLASVCFVSEDFYAANRSVDDSWRISNQKRRLYSAGLTVVRDYSQEDRLYQYLFSSLSSDRSKRAKTLMKLYTSFDEETDTYYNVPYSFVSDLERNEALFEDIFVYVTVTAVFLAVFAAFLLAGFISGSVNAKKKDIGILRAVGARESDVFRIFLFESLLISLSCFLLGSLGAFFACKIANLVLVQKEVLTTAFFLFGWQNLLIVLAISLLTALVATAVPVALNARKNPIDAIRSI